MADDVKLRNSPYTAWFGVCAGGEASLLGRVGQGPTQHTYFLKTNYEFMSFRHACMNAYFLPLSRVCNRRLPPAHVCERSVQRYYVLNIVCTLDAIASYTNARFRIQELTAAERKPFVVSIQQYVVHDGVPRSQRTLHIFQGVVFQRI